MKRFFNRNRSESSESSGEGQLDVASVNQETVLIVEDSPTEAHVLKGILKQGGYGVLTAVDGESGVAEAQHSKPDLILMDVVMPGLNGFQATRQLSRNPETSSIPIIMVTTKNQDTDRAWALRQGAREYVVKPVKADELLKKIRFVLNA
ncbi:MAG: response regulator [Gammaproteobacteria bacterium]|nr:response regulator [Gammaproteobacteria bacterium]